MNQRKKNLLKNKSKNVKSIYENLQEEVKENEKNHNGKYLHRKRLRVLYKEDSYDKKGQSNQNR